MRNIRLIASVIALVPLVAAQTYTSCNPLTSTSCAADTGLSSSTFSSDFTASSSLPSNWNVTAGSSLISYGSDGATFTIKESGDAPTIETSFYIFFGVISVFLKSAPGTGIVSSIVLESDDLDEIDWEWIGGNDTSVETNYFGKGNTTTYNRATWIPASAAQTTSHNYTVNWQSDKTEWYVDGTLLRTLNYADALDGKNYPQTPMRLKIGIWAGGDTTLNSAGTVTWAGGDTDYSQGPFSMSLQKVEISNQNPATSYSYGDETGAYSSIKIVSGDSDTVSASTANSTSNSTGATSGTVVSSLSGATDTALAASSSPTATVAASAAVGSVDSISLRTLGAAVVIIALLFVW